MIGNPLKEVQRGKHNPYYNVTEDNILNEFKDPQGVGHILP